jgi:hypothetical protein
MAEPPPDGIVPLFLRVSVPASLLLVAPETSIKNQYRFFAARNGAAVPAKDGKAMHRTHKSPVSS